MIATCRTLTKGLSDCKVFKVIEQVDVSEGLGIQRLVKELDGAKIDLLVNNAGILSVRKLAVLLLCDLALLLHVDPCLLCTPHRGAADGEPGECQHRRWG